MSSVLQSWVETIPWKQQSILFSGLRGPDDQNCRAVKKVTKWMRAVSQNNADPLKGYMQVTGLPAPIEGGDLDTELERLPVHFVHHFADALRVIACHHPDPMTWSYAESIHNFIAEELFHFIPEAREVFLHRHRDKTEHA